MKTYTLNNENVTFKQGVEMPNADGDLIWYSLSEVRTWDAARLSQAGIIVTEPPIVEPSEPVPYIPEMVDMRQARLALLSAGLLSTINAAIDTLGEAAKIEWEFASVVRRDSPLIAMVQQGNGLTDAQVDELFLLASTL